MKNLLLLFFAVSFQFAVAQTPCTGGTAGPYDCNGYDLQAHFSLGDLNAGSGNDSWGWKDPLTNIEYAIVGLNNGTAFFDISNPISPIYLGKLPGHNNNGPDIWRDMKTYKDHVFIVSEQADHGMQVFDLKRLRNVPNPPATFTEDAHFDGFGRAHNISINEDSGYAYAVGGNDTFNRGAYFVNIQDPTNPIDAGGIDTPGTYLHDVQVVNYSGPDSDYTGQEILFGSNGNEGSEVLIMNVTDKSNPVVISEMSYNNVGFSHQGWFTEDQRYFLLGDETDETGFGFNSRTLVFDFDDLDNPVFHTEYFGPTPASDHNGYVKGNTYYMANYRYGMTAIDITDIAAGNLNEIGSFDSFPANNNAGANNGAWNVYPFFDSGNIIISDLAGGFFLVKSNAVDNTDPVAVCQDITVSLDASGEVVVAANLLDGGSSDDSGYWALALSQNVFDCSDLGTNTVTVTVTDPSGNTDTCSATITVVDELGAAFSCAADATVGYDTGSAFYTLPDHVANGDVTATDNCSTALTITQTPAAGTELTVGVYTVSFETTDDEGNTSNCSFELTVEEVLSSEDVILARGLSLFPNPAENHITIASTQRPLTAISVYDISGKKLKEVNPVNAEEFSLDISMLAAGTYFVNINNLVTKRIIKN